MRTRATASTIAKCAAVLALIPAVAATQSDSHDHAPSNVMMGDLISLVSSDPRLRIPLAEAVAMWSGCPQLGVGFPRLEAVAEISASDLRPGEQYRRKITVAMGDRDHPGRRFICGTFQETSIILHRRTLDGFGRALDCGMLGRILAHEIGHALGLGHATPSEVDLQGEQVMTGTILANVKHPSQVGNRECEAVDLHWMTSLELAGAQALGFGSLAGASARSVDEIAAPWHEAVAMGLVDAAHPVGSALAAEEDPEHGGLP